MNEGCIFCSAAVKDEVFAESQMFMAVYNAMPLRPGHSLVLPKKHVRSLLDLDESEISDLTLYATRVTRLLLSEFRAKAFDWLLQDGEAAGQTIPHMHLHVIPREFGDFANPKDWWPALDRMKTLSIDAKDRFRLTPSEMQKIVQALRSSGRSFGLTA